MFVDFLGSAFHITPTGEARLEAPAPEVHPQPIKFDAAYLDRRMAEHRKLIAEAQREHELEIVRKWIGRAAMSIPQVPGLHLALHQERPTDPTLEPLNMPVEWMRYCEPCDSEQRFVASMRCDRGLIARCTKCGDLRVAPYTRTNSDAWEAYT